MKKTAGGKSDSAIGAHRPAKTFHVVFFRMARHFRGSHIRGGTIWSPRANRLQVMSPLCVYL